MKVSLARTLSGWSPADDEAVRVSRKWQPGESVVVDLKKPRAHRSLRRYWGLCNLVMQNSDKFKSPSQVSDYLKIRSGHCSLIASEKTGEIFQIPDSIDYDTLDEPEFQEVWKRVVDVVCEDILPGITHEEIATEIMQCAGLAGGMR